MTTTDGGAHWAFEDVKELPYSLNFLNASQGWMITDKGVWGTEEGGRSWKKLSGVKGLERLYFLDENHGFAVGEQKAIYETSDGGKNWTKREVATPRPMEARDVVYSGVTFFGPKHGIIIGSWSPDAVSQQMEWLNAEQARKTKLPMSALVMETQDGGKTWQGFESNIQGKLIQTRFFDANTILGLVEYRAGGKAPSEVFQIDLKTHTTKSLFHQEQRIARSVVILPGGEVVVAAIEMAGTFNQVPIPGKLRMMTTTSMSTWLTEKSDYRAEARIPMLAAADANNVWVATDTGMILKRTP